jgi:hypothetical protein
VLTASHGVCVGSPLCSLLYCDRGWGVGSTRPFPSSNCESHGVCVCVQREQYERDRESLMAEVISPSKTGGRNIAVTLTDAGGAARQFQLDRDAVMSSAMEHPDVAAHHHKVGCRHPTTTIGS